MNIITKSALKLLKSTNGKVNYTSLCNYITGKGFLVIELHTDKGDEILRRFECYDKYAGEKGITVMQKHVSFVIIDSTLSTDDKVRILLHEIGHIELHFSDKRTLVDISGVERENQAEIFAYTVLRMSKFRPLFAIRLKSVFKYALIVAAIILVYFYRADNSAVPSNANISQPGIASEISAPDSTVNTNLEENNNAGAGVTTERDSVYAMPTGKVFHEIDCSYVNPAKARKLTIAEAESDGLRPCSRCTPTNN